MLQPSLATLHPSTTLFGDAYNRDHEALNLKQQTTDQILVNSTAKSPRPKALGQNPKPDKRESRGPLPKWCRSPSSLGTLAFKSMSVLGLGFQGLGYRVSGLRVR